MKSDLFPSPTHPARTVYGASRNGCDGYIRYPLMRRLVFTSGIEKFCKAADAFWILEVIATEATPLLLQQWAGGAALGIIELLADDRKTKFSMTTADDAPPILTQSIYCADFPTGSWMLYLACDSVLERGTMNTVLSLPSEN